jgi:chromosome segregation ATPase
VEEVSEPTKFQRFMRRVLIWFSVVAGAFLAGFLVFYFVLHQPKVADLTTAQEEIQTLEAQLDAANTELLALNNADKHRTLLQVLVDTYEARLALVKEEPVEAKAALSGTAASLNEINDEIAGFDSDLGEILPQRLALIKANIDRDPETALADCDQMIADLLAVEKALYP